MQKGTQELLDYSPDRRTKRGHHRVVLKGTERNDGELTRIVDRKVDAYEPDAIDAYHDDENIHSDGSEFDDDGFDR